MSGVFACRSTYRSTTVQERCFGLRLLAIFNFLDLMVI